MADLTSDERARLCRHTGWSILEPFSDYQSQVVLPALDRCNDHEAALTEVRNLLSQADAVWAKYNASIGKQELAAAGDITFHGKGERRLLRTYRQIGSTIAQTLGFKTNFSTGGGIKYRG